VLNDLLADVYIFTDAVSGQQSGNSPGYGVTLVAETTSGCLISAECCSTQAAELPRGEVRGGCCCLLLAACTAACMPWIVHLGAGRLVCVWLVVCYAVVGTWCKRGSARARRGRGPPVSAWPLWHEQHSSMGRQQYVPYHHSAATCSPRSTAHR
jgi:hypothetical protein